ncbi:hypothetical protein L1987_23915 [Smallanthus sonchifolius]|uniref:Uncharacterized protein n=1 Tax=Smallanthus sonchifolius TaxID=185202 RepID=A0ACB9IIZ9_9ASTR|nr:hypothetical protein L1987_23915 [Smallanthus sonchifolius]
MRRIVRRNLNEIQYDEFCDAHACEMEVIKQTSTSAIASGQTGCSKVLAHLVDELQEPGVAVELRLKIDQNHSDLKGGYAGLQSKDELLYQQVSHGNTEGVKKLRSEGAGLEVVEL